jgi:hypothetical protein
MTSAIDSVPLIATTTDDVERSIDTKNGVSKNPFLNDAKTMSS